MKGFVTGKNGWIVSGNIIGKNNKEYIINLKGGVRYIPKEKCYLSLGEAIKSQMKKTGRF